MPKGFGTSHRQLYLVWVYFLARVSRPFSQIKRNPRALSAHLSILRLFNSSGEVNDQQKSHDSPPGYRDAKEKIISSGNMMTCFGQKQ